MHLPSIVVFYLASALFKDTATLGVLKYMSLMHISPCIINHQCHKASFTEDPYDKNGIQRFILTFLSYTIRVTLEGPYELNSM